MKRSMKWIAGALCVASMAACFVGCGDEELTPMTETHVQEMNQSVAFTKDWAGSYTIKETSTTTQKQLMNTQTVTMWSNMAYNADTHAFYYAFDQEAANLGTQTVYTQPQADGSFKQYRKYSKGYIGSPIATFRDEADVKANGLQGKHVVTGEIVTIHFTSLKDAIAVFYLVDLEEAYQITDPVEYNEFWMDCYESLLEKQLDTYGLEGEFTAGGAGFAKDGGKTTFSFTVNCTTSGEGSVSVEGVTTSISDYKMSMKVNITVGDGKIQSISCGIDQSFKMEGLIKVSASSVIKDEFLYSYDESILPSEETLANW